MRGAVFFDGDQTLWDFRTALAGALDESVKALQRLVPSPTAALMTAAELTAVRDALAAEGPSRRHEDVRRAAFCEVARRCGAPDPTETAEALCDVFFRHRFASVRLYPDTASCLENTRQAGFLVGLLSNGNTYPWTVKLDDAFDVVVFGDDHGLRKPDRRLFDLAARRVKRPPLLVSIGDDPVNDVIGAKEVGWKAIWLNRAQTSHDVDTDADAVVSDLTAIPDILLRMTR